MEASFYSEYLGNGTVPQALSGTLACCDRCDTTVNGSLNIKDVVFLSYFILLPFLPHQLLSFSCLNNAEITALHRKLLIGYAMGSQLGVPFQILQLLEFESLRDNDFTFRALSDFPRSSPVPEQMEEDVTDSQTLPTFPFLSS